MDKQYIDKLAFIDIKNHQVLMTMSKGKTTWYIPGGKREADETDIDALVREMHEETTVTLIPQSLKPYGVFIAQAHGKPEGVMVKMTCYQGQFTGELKPSSEIERITYVGYEEYERLGPVDKLITDDLKSKNLIS